uniref:UBX domain-containing protein 11 isoform X2 n=1 Tax=Gasterosteus aculeatus aculeatus TaxID=481459 RepID=UPI001A990F5B|nr:UBX domain-containing protein 11 isoform X2 [Gasterosteus aculeatus aculeatus]
MSSPLSMLKKRRRAPLPDPASEQRDRQKVPIGRNMLKGFQAAGADDESSDSTPSPTAANDATASKPKAASKKGVPPSDFELMSAMIRRVGLLERKVMCQAKEIERKDKRISLLEAKLRFPEDSESARDLSGRDSLERKCQRLQNRVSEMNSFLNDYGLTWVGDGGSSDAGESASVAPGFRMNFDLVQRRIVELNVLAGEGECFVRPTATGARLAKREPIQLGLYRDGIVMFDGPFRSYQERSTQRCMNDLMDGYFPSELQERFPDGVPFEVHDRRDQEFISRAPWNKFPGEGKTIRESSHGVSLKIPGKESSTDRFLKQLPNVVVKAGRVIDIRDSLRAVLQGPSDAQSSNSVILVDTPARRQISSPDRPSSDSDVIALKVRSEDGNRTYILKMRFSDTVGHLRRHLDEHRGGGLPGYDIITASPRCCFDDDHRTLQSCGLTTNAMLLLRKRQHPLSQSEIN